jgi:tetrapyrrole methylase family protein/MazG family protein
MAVVGNGHFMFDEMLHWFDIDPTEGFLVLDGVQFDPLQANPSLHTVILQTYSQVIAGDLKLQLMDIYPDDFPVTVARAVGIPGEERLERVALYELDRLSWIDYLTVVYLPKTTDERATHRQFSKLVEIVRVLRSPDGCPWDREQTHQSIRKNVLEEAYEVAEAIDLNDPDGLREELGDLLLQVALHGQMAAESGAFSVYDAIQSINDKLIRRHPHVFGGKQAEDAEAAVVNWEEIKRQERIAKGLPEERSLLESVSANMPAMSVAYKLQALAADAGFEWEDVAGVYDKLEEELNELREAEDETEELGDVLFVLVNLARFLLVDPEEALAKTNQKFRRRFAYIEKMLSDQGKTFSDTSLEEMDTWWNEAKKIEKP